MRGQYVYRHHVIIEIVGYILNLLAVIYAAVCACTIEGEIPTHFDITGQPDAYGPASYMLVAPLILLVSCIGLGLMVHLLPPKATNTGFQVRPGHEAAVYGDFNTMIALMNPIFGLFSLIFTMTFTNGEATLGVTALLMVLLFADIIVLFIKAWRDNRD